MKSLFLSYSFVLFCAICYSQQSNPFDIPVRPEKTVLKTEKLSPLPSSDTIDLQATVAKDSAANTMTQNPFDISTGSNNNESSISEERTNRTNRQASTVVTNDTKMIVLVYTLVMLIILTLAISMNRQRFVKILKSSLNSNHLRTLHRDNNAWSNGQIIILYIFFFLNVSFTLWLILMKTYTDPPFGLLTIGLGLIAVYVIRHIVMWTMSMIYSLGQELEIHNYSIVLHNIIIGILVLPFVLILEFFSPATFSIALITLSALAGLIYALRQGKSLLMSLGMRAFNPFYFFIYLCAIEIAPLMVAYKILMGAL